MFGTSAFAETPFASLVGVIYVLTITENINFIDFYSGRGWASIYTNGNANWQTINSEGAYIDPLWGLIDTATNSSWTDINTE